MAELRERPASCPITQDFREPGPVSRKKYLGRHRSHTRAFPKCEVTAITRREYRHRNALAELRDYLPAPFTHRPPGGPT